MRQEELGREYEALTQGVFQITKGGMSGLLRSVGCLRYLWEIYLEIPGSWKQKKRILQKIGNSIQDYLSEGSKVSYSQMKRRFGEPKQIAAAYVSEMETHEILSNMKSSEKLVRIFLIAAMAIITIWIGYVSVCYYGVQKDANGFATVEVIEIERNETPTGE